MTDSRVGNCCAVNDEGNTQPATQLSGLEFGSAEVQLEAEIQAAMRRLCTVPDRCGKFAAWREMCGLIDKRTPERKRFMARMQGLA